MFSDLVRSEALEDGSLRITPLGSLEDISLLPAVLAVFEQEFRRKHDHFVLDLSGLPALPAGWVALIFELTARARRRGGDLCVTNLQRKAQGDLLNFQPETYLCLDEMDFFLPPAASFAGSAASERSDAAIQVGAAVWPEREAAAVPEPAADPALPRQAEPPPALPSGSITIPSRVDALYRACDFVLDFAARQGFGESDLSRIKISVYEASLNAIEHAYHSDATQKVSVEVAADSERMIIQIVDHGDGFEVKTNEDFDVTAAAAARRTGGMGLHIIRRSMDRVTYHRDPKHGNRLIMEKRLPRNASPGPLREGDAEETPWPEPSGTGEMP
ncbi:MAG TPA: ATP-binding protein [bacterium]|nr:ATP-binding protein [bacterium]HOC24849.1 ATP-binding protein [bacterium]HOH08912.1 ATP-binding protein [bacterium]HOY45661.1 ATP-binding protein [bacterium]HPG82788.1 ATP-binding protein [bacterium]